MLHHLVAMGNCADSFVLTGPRWVTDRVYADIGGRIIEQQTPEIGDEAADPGEARIPMIARRTGARNVIIGSVRLECPGPRARRPQASGYPHQAARCHSADCLTHPPLPEDAAGSMSAPGHAGGCSSNSCSGSVKASMNHARTTAPREPGAGPVKPPEH